MPELAPSMPHLAGHVARMGDALLKLIREEPIFAPPEFTEVEGWDLEDLLQSQNLTPPAIAVLLAGFDIVPDGSNRQTRLDTLWEVVFIRAMPPARTAGDRWLSGRLALALWTLISRTAGVLYGEPTLAYPAGEPLNMAILRMQRVPRVRRFGTGMLAQPVSFLLRSVLNAATGEPYDD